MVYKLRAKISNFLGSSNINFQVKNNVILYQNISLIIFMFYIIIQLSIILTYFNREVSIWLQLIQRAWFEY